jgi:HSP20 family molecular chaperone IbpA
MSNVYIQRVREPEVEAEPVLARMNELFFDVQNRAFEIFARRGFMPGHALEDWLRAEREVLAAPPAELIDRDDEFQLNIAVPGFTADQVHPTATPREIVVVAEATSERSGDEGKLRWSEIGNRHLCRRIPLPQPINVDRVTATLDRGILTITAKKSIPVKSKPLAITAAA